MTEKAELDRDLVGEIARELLSLPEMDDKEQLRSAIRDRVEAMNALDRFTFNTNLGRLVKEEQGRRPGTKYVIATWSLLATVVLFIALTTGSAYLILKTNLWLIVKIPLGLMAVYWCFLGITALSRVIFRVVNGRDQYLGEL